MNAAIMLKEVQRVLKVGGIYINISYGAPQARLLHFQREHLGFTLECLALKNTKSSKGGKDSQEGRDSEHYCYIMVKRNDAEGLAAENWERVVEQILKEQSQDNLYDDDEDYDGEEENYE